GPHHIYTLSLHDALPISGRGRFADNQISTGTTPLFRAVQNNDLEVVQALLAKGADPNINTMGYTAFLLAAGAGPGGRGGAAGAPDRKSTRLNSSHRTISY